VPTRRVELHEQAGAEYDAAFDWYLRRSPEAARNFDTEVARVITQVLAAPERWAVALTKRGDVFSSGFRLF